MIVSGWRMNSVAHDYMEEILKTIDKLIDRMNKFKEQYSKKRTDCYIFINRPIFRTAVMGHRKLLMLVPELTNDASRPDYTLFQDCKKLAFIGTQKFGTNKNMNKYLHYSNQSSIRYFITRDSDRKGMYDNSFF